MCQSKLEQNETLVSNRGQVVKLEACNAARQPFRTDNEEGKDRRHQMS